MSFLSHAGYAGPREVQYLFIDGAQLASTLEEVGQEWFDCPIELDYARVRGEHTKVFYYDCLPAKKSTESEAQHTQRREDKLRFFNELRDLQGWHVSEGIARHRRKERQEQKEVDILIAVDMLTHTHRRNMHRLTFLTGDQDFAPLVEAVVREGMYVQLWFPLGHTSQDLKQFADDARPLDAEFLLGMATEHSQRHHALPTRQKEVHERPPNAQPLEQAWAGTAKVGTLWLEQQGGHVATGSTPMQTGRFLTVRHREADKVKKMFARDFAQLEWRPAVTS